MILCFSYHSLAQTEVEKKTVQILPDSELTITGDTNINKFKCDYNTKSLERTRKVKYTVDGSTLDFNDASLILNNKGFDCGNNAINKDFHALLQTDEYPEIVLELKQLHMKSHDRAKADLTITIAGKSKNYSLPVNLHTNPTCFTGKLQLNINDFDLKPPKKIFGLIVVKEEIDINFNLTINKF